MQAQLYQLDINIKFKKKNIDDLCFTFVLSFLKAKMHFTMSENALALRVSEAGSSLDRIRSLLANASGRLKFYTPDK